MSDTDLLIKYMAHVIEREGVNLMQYAPALHGGPTFSDKELAHLGWIDEKARELLDDLDTRDGAGSA